MRASKLRSPLYVLAIAVVVGCVLGPGPFVSAAGGQNQQTPKRGKNGTPDSSSAPASSGQGQSSATGSSSQPASPSAGADSGSATPPSDQSAAPNSGSAAGSQSAADDKSNPQAQSGGNNQSNSGHGAAHWPSNSGSTSQNRAEPPPFDRPPISSQQSPQSTNRRADQRPDSGSDSDQDSGGATSSDNHGGYSQPESGRGSSRPPVLERSPDLGPSRNGSAIGNGGRSGPPVLRRPGDDSSDEGSAPPSQPTEHPEATTTRQSGGQQQEETIKLAANLVDIEAVVSDRSGRFIPGLNANDFNLSEDGVRQKIAFFGDEDRPFSVALLLDVSPSVSNSARDIQDAALAFIDELRSEDKVMVVAFDQHVRFLTDFTNDRRELSYAIENTRTGNGTSVYEAVYDTVANRLKYVEGRKAMILFSDGEDTTSRRVTYEDTINLVSESGVLVYGLRYPDTGGYGQNVPFPRTRLPLPFPIPGTRNPLPFPFPFPWPGGRGPWGHFDSSGNSGGASANYWGGQWGRRGGGQRNYGRDYMRDITEAGGGPVFDARTIGDMSRLARQIADELRHVYVLSYYPTNPLSNGGYRTVRVSIAGRDDLAVRHRKGYYADQIAKRSTT